MQKTRIAINGFGRIGKSLVRAIYEYYSDKYLIIAINDPGTDMSVQACLLKHDSVHGNFAEDVKYNETCLFINDESIEFFHDRDPKNLPWKKLNIDLVFECTGKLTNIENAKQHILSGAEKVLVSAPSEDAQTIIYGVNEYLINKATDVYSNGSCTTNCVAPIVNIIHKEFGIISGFMTTVHAATNDQKIVDSYHKDARRARSGMLSIIPTKTGAATAIGLVIPELNGKFDGIALRVPTANVSLVDLSLILNSETTADAVNQLFKTLKHYYHNIINYTDESLVSIDFTDDRHSGTVDGTQTYFSSHNEKHLLKVFAWYDNEWGFANRMLDLGSLICS